MDDANETIEIVERLCVMIGIIMEDASVTALLTSESENVPTQLAVLERAGRDIIGLVEAASVITTRWPDTLR